MIQSKLSNATKLKLLMPLLYLVVSILFFVQSWPKEPQPHNFVGAVMTLMAFALWIIARIQLGNAFSLAPKANFLVTSGLYSKLRHPVYYFSILAVVGIGTFIWEAYMLLPVVLLVVLEYLRIQKEEKLLVAKFGADYLVYKKRTWI